MATGRQTKSEHGPPENQRRKTSKSGKRSVVSEYLPVIEYQWTDIGHEPFFHGLIPKQETERLLTKQGDFIARITEVNGALRVVISVNRSKEQVSHFLIQQKPQGEYFIGRHLFHSISDLIAFYWYKKQPLDKSNQSKLNRPIIKQPWQISNQTIKCVYPIGGGGHFGEVYRAWYRSGSSSSHQQRPGSKQPSFEVAVKKAKKQPNSAQLAHLIREAANWRKFDHPNVLKFHGIALQENPVLIVVELATQGSLLTYLRKEGLHMVNLTERTQYCLEAAMGMEYLEKQRCIHGSLGARNCLLDEKKTLKIADYGFYSPEEQKKICQGKSSSIRWQAPETIITSFFTLQSDVWSFGILLWEIFTDGLVPYQEMSTTEMKKKVAFEQYHMDPPQGTPPPIATVMSNCWQSPEERPGFSKIRSDIETAVKKSTNLDVVVQVPLPDPLFFLK